jgi:hypothetical protein
LEAFKLKELKNKNDFLRVLKIALSRSDDDANGNS